MVDKHYRWDFIGLSTDDKPTPATSEKVANGSTFYEGNTSKLYVWYKDRWYEKTGSGGGSYVLPTASADTLGGIKVGSNLSINSETGVLSADSYTLPTASSETLGGVKVGTNLSIDENGVLSASGGGGSLPAQFKVLTSADYNAPSGSDEKTYIMPIWLEPGFYIISNGTKFRYSDSTTPTTPTSDIPLIVTTSPTSSTQKICYTANSTDGIRFNTGTSTFSTFVTSSLNSNSTSQPLAASRGKYLNEKIDALIKVGNSAPTTSTAGTLGQLYTDTSTMHTYQCTDATVGATVWTQRW